MYDFYPGEKSLFKGRKIPVTLEDCKRYPQPDVDFRVVLLDSEKLKDAMSYKADCHQNINQWPKLTGSWNDLSVEEIRVRARELSGVETFLRFLNEGNTLNLRYGDAYGKILEGDKDPEGNRAYRFTIPEGSHRAFFMWSERPAVLFAVPHTECAMLIERFGSNLTPEEAGYDLDNKAKAAFVGSIQDARALGDQLEGSIIDHFAAANIA